MEEYVPNSRKSKETSEKPEKRLEKVTKGVTKSKKKGEMQKVKDIFIADDMSKIKDYVLMEVLVPTIKRAISDIVSNGIDMILYGEAKHDRKSTPAGNVSYASYYAGRGDKKDRIAAKASSAISYDDISFENRGDAETVLSAMEDSIERYGFVSILDMFDLADVSTSNYALGKYGWRDLHEAKTVFVRGEYMIKLPKPEPLN